MFVRLLALGGAGAAARFTAAGAKAARIQSASRAFVHTLQDLIAAAEDIDQIKSGLLLARRHSIRHGNTQRTLQERRQTEQRDGRCRICGETSHHTPAHRRGHIDYR